MSRKDDMPQYGTPVLNCDENKDAIDIAKRVS
jgi:hypothetical protein